MMVAFLLLGLQAAKPAHAAGTTFTVNKTGDGKDRKIDGVCDASRRRGQQCTLRAALEEANATPGTDTINFAIGGTASVKTISPASPLPTITEALTIDGYSQPGASPNTNTTLSQGTNAVLKIQLNGTNAGIGADGLKIEASDSTIKGLVINRFRRNGIFIDVSSATGNKVEGNFIGTNAAGKTDLGNHNIGVAISDAPNTTIGGTAAGAGNLISGNPFSGVFIGFSSATGSKVEDNTIRNNAKNGVVIVGSAADNAIEGNQIFANGEDGVRVEIGKGNSVLSNQIFANGGLGIDLDPDGVTNNDGDDPATPQPDPDKDTGANNRQNFPVITSATKSNTTGFTTISGTLNSNPNQSFTIQCFVADNDPSGHGEGLIPLTQTTVTDTNGDGNVNFSCPGSPVPQPGQTVSATATNTSGTASGTAIGDTSEFSENKGVVLGP